MPSGKYVYIVKAIVDKNDASADLYSDSESEESEPVIIPEPANRCRNNQRLQER